MAQAKPSQSQAKASAMAWPEDPRAKATQSQPKASGFQAKPSQNITTTKSQSQYKDIY